VEGRPAVSVDGLQDGPVGLLQQVFGDLPVPVDDGLKINGRFFWRHDTRHNDTQHDDNQHCRIVPYDKLNNLAQHNDNQHIK